MVLPVSPSESDCRPQKGDRFVQAIARRLAAPTDYEVLQPMRVRPKKVLAVRPTPSLVSLKSWP